MKYHHTNEALEIPLLLGFRSSLPFKYDVHPIALIESDRIYRTKPFVLYKKRTRNHR